MSDSERPTARLQTSLTETVEFPQPEDTNALGRVLGSVVFHWLDMCGTVAAMRFTGRRPLTVTADHAAFEGGASAGVAVPVTAYVFEVGTTSMSVKADAVREAPDSGDESPVASAILRYVSIDSSGEPTTVPELRCETDEERALRDAALEERARRIADLRDRVE